MILYFVTTEGPLLRLFTEGPLPRIFTNIVHYVFAFLSFLIYFFLRCMKELLVVFSLLYLLAINLLIMFVIF